MMLAEFVPALNEHGVPASGTTENAGKLAARLVRTARLIPGTLGRESEENGRGVDVGDIAWSA
ncbi:hypothetical protein C1701_02970 [Actinoalloteichus sp. AHMU CJ021]|uniref:Uncharacterized protein n=1 Tax=Actinoalloteichus caeruleus DSM 43889 TaxID=1120930 RepID=A0ABT1JHX4_ACTCY|nr:hypothetical protein C1701_02970 [Actinoalloteichus sp. AHMU CJ021]MCP2331376.1 hypothetical protein [Actinoalloteichus caeruleus DSM 43889]